MSKMRAVLVRGLGSSFVLLAACACATQPSFSAERNMMIDCLIRATPEHGMLRLEAIATGRQAVRGQYRLEVSKQSSSGTSQNVQSGAFDLQPDRDDLLTTVILDGSAVGHYRAKLTLDSDFGSVTCVSP
jgi:hypothetical protein